MNRGATIRSVVLLTLGALTTRAQTPPAFDVMPLVGASSIGRLLSVSPSGEVTLKGGTIEKAALEDISEWNRVSTANAVRASATPAFDGVAVLRSGMALRIASPSGSGDAIEIATPFAESRVSIAALHLASLRLAPLRDGDDGGFGRALDAPAQTKDLLFAWTSDDVDLKRFSVKIESFQRDSVTIATGAGRSGSVPLSRVYGIVFGTDHGAAPNPLPTPRVIVEGAFDSDLRGKLAGWDGVQCRLRLAEGIDLTLPCGAITRVAIDTGRVAYLNDVDPAVVEQTPALDRVRPWLRNRTPIGEGIELGGVTRRRGVCLVPKTSLTWNIADLTGGQPYDVFEAVVGIDDRSDPKLAHAIFRVLVDGDVAFESKPMIVGQAPESIRVEIDGKKQITLETDFGDNLDLGDHCVFADARLRQT